VAHRHRPERCWIFFSTATRDFRNGYGAYAAATGFTGKIREQAGLEVKTV
jgi:hypothetical protein